MKMIKNKRLIQRKFTKVFLTLSSFVVMIAVPIQLMNSPAFADKYDDQINAIKQDIANFNAQAAALAKQANTLQSALAIITAERSAIQAQLDLSQARYDQLVSQITETEKKIQDNQDALGKIIADLYVDDKISPIEMLASSKNISDFMDKQEYRNSVRNELKSTIGKVKTLKKTLEGQKIEVEKVLAQQKSQKEVLVAKETEQQNLLSQTQGQEAAYQQLSAQKAVEMEAVQAQQRAAIAALTNNGKNTAGSVGSFEYRNYSGNQGPCGGGYPGSVSGIFGSPWGCNYGLDDGVDSWALYNRECVSYAAWAAYYRFGKRVGSFSGMGFAWQWPSTASALMGADVDNTPTVGSVAITPRQYFTPMGHAMIVEEVYGDGWIRVSQYNFAGTGEYSTMDLKVSSAVYVHFQNR